MADSRVKDFTQEASPDGTENFGVDKASYANAKRVTLDQVKTFVWKVMTAPAAIAAITNESNWSDVTGEYTGSTALFTAGDVYYDTSTQIRYQYDGVQVVRWYANNIF